MKSSKKVVYYLCTDPGRPGRVSRRVWQILAEKGIFSAAGIRFDQAEVMEYQDEAGHRYHFVPTQRPVCWDYPRYLPEMKEKFSDYDFAGMITWHEGEKAPDKILSVHTLGDVHAGIFGPAHPVYMRNLLHGLERSRLRYGLEDFTTVSEATHWSGTAIAGHSPEQILEYPVPMVDIEVGSREESWENPQAYAALAEGLLQVFCDDVQRVRPLLCVGGMHFDPNFAQAIFTQWDHEAFGVTHILANQWLVSGGYDSQEGYTYMKSAMASISGGVEALVFHDKLKGCYKDLLRQLASEYKIPLLRHQLLRKPEQIEWEAGDGTS